MAIKYFYDLVQGTDEWLAARCGILTASEMKLVMTPALKTASNDKERSHLFELAAQRITRYVEPHYISDDMLRGYNDEQLAKAYYSEKYAEVKDVGFITNDKFGFTLGYSPDGLVGDIGLIEVKSRRAKYQIETITTKQVPTEYYLQLQTGLLVSERSWIDFISYSGGLPMITMRVFPDERVKEAITSTAKECEDRILKKMEEFSAVCADPSIRTIPTERTIEKEIYA